MMRILVGTRSPPFGMELLDGVEGLIASGCPGRPSCPVWSWTTAMWSGDAAERSARDYLRLGRGPRSRRR